MNKKMFNRRFQVQPEFFSHSDASQELVMPTASNNYNLSFPSWESLVSRLQELNETGNYKLLLLARHGQGYHNAAIEKYGQDVWDDWLGKQRSDGHWDWFDSHLTPLGKEQTAQTGRNIAPIVTRLGPVVYYSSPMRRCLETFSSSWSQVVSTSVTLNVVENLRERLGVHPCDARVTRDEAVSEYQDSDMAKGKLHLEYEEGFKNEDTLYKDDYRETDEEMDTRLHDALVTVCRDSSQVISITAHSGAINAMLRVCGNREVPLETSGWIPILVKFE